MRITVCMPLELSSRFCWSPISLYTHTMSPSNLAAKAPVLDRSLERAANNLFRLEMLQQCGHLYHFPRPFRRLKCLSVGLPARNDPLTLSTWYERNVCPPLTSASVRTEIAFFQFVWQSCFRFIGKKLAKCSWRSMLLSTTVVCRCYMGRRASSKLQVKCLPRVARASLRHESTDDTINGTYRERVTAFSCIWMSFMQTTKDHDRKEGTPMRAVLLYGDAASRSQSIERPTK